MSACREVRKWVTENILVPVTEVITEAQEKCEEVGEWIEENVEQQVEQQIEQAHEECSDWPWPIDWICSVVVAIVTIIVTVIVTVVKWVVKIVCQIVTVVVGIVVTYIVRVVSWIVTFVVCVFSEPVEALKSLGDLWNIHLDLWIDGPYSLVDTLLGDVIGIADDLGHILDLVADKLGWLGVLLGVLKGFVDMFREFVSIIRDVVKGAKDVVLGVLDGNLCRILRGGIDLLTGLGRGVLATGFGVLWPVRAGGWVAGGVRDSVHQRNVQDIVNETIDEAFKDQEARRRRSRSKVIAGLRFDVDARRMYLSSENRDLDLKTLHDEGVIDLYALAGYPSACGRTTRESEGEVVYAGTNLKVSLMDIGAYLQDGPGSVAEFHVFGFTRARMREHLEVAQRKAATLGLRLRYTTGDTQTSDPRHVPLQASVNDHTVQRALFAAWFGRTGVNDDLSRIPAVGHFRYPDLTELGLASSAPRESGVTWRNRAPDWTFRFVLIHEFGHYWGLAHENRQRGQRTIDEIMWKRTGGPQGSDLGGWAIPEYALLGGEPRFTLDDVRTTWEWITTDGADSLLP